MLKISTCLTLILCATLAAALLGGEAHAADVAATYVAEFEKNTPTEAAPVDRYELQWEIRDKDCKKKPGHTRHLDKLAHADDVEAKFTRTITTCAGIGVAARIRAVNSAGNSGWTSWVVVAHPRNPIRRPGKPALIKITVEAIIKR